MNIKNKIGIILNYIWRIWFVLLGFTLTIILFLPVFLLSFQKRHYKYAYLFIRIWCFCLFYGMGFRYDFINQSSQFIDKQRQYIIIANHTSMMDIMLTCLLFPNHSICFVGKKELEKIPVFGLIYRRICVMVDRKSAKSRAKVYEKCAERMAEGDSIVIFPEGGVPEDTRIILDKFKDGAFNLSSTHNLPLAVFTFVGLKEMFPFDNSKGFPGRVKVYFNAVLEPTSEASINKEKAFDLIQKTLINN